MHILQEKRELIKFNHNNELKAYEIYFLLRVPWT